MTVAEGLYNLSGYLSMIARRDELAGARAFLELALEELKQIARQGLQQETNVAVRDQLASAMMEVEARSGWIQRSLRGDSVAAQLLGAIRSAARRYGFNALEHYPDPGMPHIWAVENPFLRDQLGLPPLEGRSGPMPIEGRSGPMAIEAGPMEIERVRGGSPRPSA